MERIAIIPARGGSKRLPRKNILPVLGVPMIQYPIQTARRSGLFDEIFVSTEDAEIAEIASSAGAKVIDRPNELAGDRATVVQVCMHLLDTLKSADEEPECFCCIYPTAILINSNDLVQAYRLLHEAPAADGVMGVSRFNLQPVQALVQKDGFLASMWPEFHGLQSQFQPDLVASNGTFYWTETGALREAESFYMHRLKGFLIPWYRAVDIDTQEDLKIAKLFLENIYKRA